MAQWTYEDLDKAVRHSQLPQEYSGNGIIDILNSQGYDIAESQFIDTLSLNLSRGQFLLIIAGDVIRRDVEAMTAYLQSTPNLFFTLPVPDHVRDNVSALQKSNDQKQHWTPIRLGAGL